MRRLTERTIANIDDKKEAAEGRINLVVKDSGSLGSEAKDDGQQKVAAQS